MSHSQLPGARAMAQRLFAGNDQLARLRELVAPQALDA